MKAKRMDGQLDILVALRTTCNINNQRPCNFFVISQLNSIEGNECKAKCCYGCEEKNTCGYACNQRYGR